MADRNLMLIIGGADSGSPKAAPTPSDDGYYNLQNVIRAINSIKPVTNAAAKIIAYQAETALDKALAKAAESSKLSSTSQEIVLQKIKRESGDVLSHLTWHRERFGKDPLGIYEHAPDLKKYAIMAFNVYNQAYEGVKTGQPRIFYFEAMKSFGELLQRAKEKFEKDVFPTVAVWAGIIGVGLIGYGWWSLKMVNARRSLPKDGF